MTLAETKKFVTDGINPPETIIEWVEGCTLEESAVIQKKGANYVNSLEFLVAAKGAAMDLGIALDFGGEERVFKVVEQHSREGEVRLDLQCEDFRADETLIVSFRRIEYFEYRLKSAVWVRNKKE